MNIAVIFAGGIGTRMGKTDKPKQFIEISGKPIIIQIRWIRLFCCNYYKCKKQKNGKKRYYKNW